MANNCHQTLIIKGNQKIVEEIISRLCSEDKIIKFSNIIPIPSEEKLKELQLTEKEWCWKKYEVDFDFGILYGMQIKEKEACIVFDTRNSPCRQFLFQLCQVYKDTNFYLSFIEPYGNFQGYVECENGEVLQEYIGEDEWEFADEIEDENNDIIVEKDCKSSPSTTNNCAEKNLEKK